jgi:hypothetical protein
MPKYTEVVILCEDLQQDVFARTFLQVCNITKNRIRTVVAPHGRGAGAAFVRRQFPIEVKTYRRKKNNINICLVVIVDADTQTVHDRFAELDQALIQNNLMTRQIGEKIGVFIPKRNIETWIWFLKGDTVNEDDIYDHLPEQRECKPHVKELAKNRKIPLPADAPPSLHIACNELGRIL